MNNLRLTIAMFILAAALAPALIIGFGSGSDASAEQRAPSPDAPPISPQAFKEAGLKQAPWVGQVKARAQPVEAVKPGAAGAAPSEPAPAKPTGKPIAVVELFTSEGCSSCPPADRVLAKIADEVKGDPSMILMAFHVDYWDHLGWKDPFASRGATDRQHAYAKAFGEDRVYTPQMVVGGGAGKGFIGSDEVKARSVIDEVLKAGAPVARVTLGEAAIRPGQTARVDATLAPSGDARLPGGVRMVFALVEDGLTTNVKRGENEGRELSHQRVVRVFAEAPVDKDGRSAAELAVPAGIKPDNCRLIALAQDPVSMKILGAEQRALGGVK